MHSRRGVSNHHHVGGHGRHGRENLFFFSFFALICFFSLKRDTPPSGQERHIYIWPVEERERFPEMSVQSRERLAGRGERDISGRSTSFGRDFFFDCRHVDVRVGGAAEAQEQRAMG